MQLKNIIYKTSQCARFTSLALILGIAPNLLATEDFSSYKKGQFTTLKTPLGTYKAAKGNAAIANQSSSSKSGSLRILGGENKEIILELSKEQQQYKLDKLSFNAERWTGAAPFSFHIYGKIKNEWKLIYNGDKLRTKALKKNITVPLNEKSYHALKFTATTKEKSGVLIDDITLYNDAPMQIESVNQQVERTPLLKSKIHAALLHLNLDTRGSKKADTLQSIDLQFNSKEAAAAIKSLHLHHLKPGEKPSETNKIKTLSPPANQTQWTAKIDKTLQQGKNQIVISATLKEKAPLNHTVGLIATSLQLKKHGKMSCPAPANAEKRIGVSVADGGDAVIRTNGKKDHCKRFRIPGMVTTKKGTLLAVYDLRWRQNHDLPGDIDVGLSRSTDKGSTWEAPRPVLDMKNYLGQPENKNGVGDPAILVDDKTGDIYIMGLLAHGLSSGFYWHVSKPGMKPKETGQLIMTKSSDDGLTWSEPINLTPTLKDPAWQLMLQGPGAGITTKKGDLVFAFQYKTKKGKGYSAQSALLYSKDRGKTWQVSSGVDYPHETTEAQVVELTDGSLMLNCRISRGGRAVFTTKDLGKTWTQHPTSGRKTFNMTGCMASILRYSSKKEGDAQDILLFSGPADGGKKRRSHQSIRYSLDEGKTWSTPYLLDKNPGAGYSCLTLIEENGKKDIGIIYEGSEANMTFERLTLEEIMGKK